MQQVLPGREFFSLTVTRLVCGCTFYKLFWHRFSGGLTVDISQHDSLRNGKFETKIALIYIIEKMEYTLYDNKIPFFKRMTDFDMLFIFFL